MFVSKDSVKQTFIGREPWSDPIKILQVHFLKKWANPSLFFINFCLFKQTLQFLQQIKVKKCPSSIQRRDSNFQPSDYESPPLTTGPGLPPILMLLRLFHY